MQKKGFTLFELMFMVIVISIGILGILVALNNGFAFLQKSRERTIAINLAREGIEAVYQIRDSNWKRRSGKKEKHWLQKDPLNGNDNTRMSTGYYILLSKTTAEQEYYYLSGSYPTGVDFSGGAETGDFVFSLCEDAKNNWSACPGVQAQSKEGAFFRQIYGIGLFKKDSSLTGGQEIGCPDGSSTTDCNNSDAKEYRFCSEVSYIGRGQGKVSLCGMLTNFPRK